MGIIMTCSKVQGLFHEFPGKFSDFTIIQFWDVEGLGSFKQTQINHRQTFQHPRCWCKSDRVPKYPSALLGPDKLHRRSPNVRLNAGVFCRWPTQVAQLFRLKLQMSTGFPISLRTNHGFHGIFMTCKVGFLVQSAQDKDPDLPREKHIFAGA